MSSGNENSAVNFNDQPEMQVGSKKFSVVQNSEMENKAEETIIITRSEMDGENGDNDNAELLIDHENVNSDSQSNIEEEKPFTIPDINTESDKKCDICSSADVENITNSLAEKVNIENIVPEVRKAACDIIKNADINKENDKPVSPDNLVNKVNKLVISRVVHQGPSNNISVVILNQETDSLKNLLVYESSSDDETESEKNWPIEEKLRTVDKSESESDSDDSESSDDEEEEEDDDDDEEIESEPKKTNAKGKLKMDSPTAEDFALKIYSENSIHDLPPIRTPSDLDIDLKKEEFLHMGHIEAIIETLITVEAIPGTPAYDLDTCLFIEDRTLKRPLGFIYDVIGPVASPLYCIRFECSRDVTELSLKKGLKVFCAPKSQYTKYVFVSELMKHRGTDASWVGDVELPPEIAAQMSDDECESESLEPRKPQKRKHNSQERHKQFEDDMNRSNALHSQAARLVDTHRHMPRISRYNDHAQRVLFNDIIPQTSRLPPSFDPSVPPPGFHAFPTRSQPVTRPSMVWTRHQPVPLRPPRCHSFLGQGQSQRANGYAGSESSYGPGTSSHPQ